MNRVLHIVSGMNRGGVETWIMNVLRRIAGPGDAERGAPAVRFDFLVETDKPADYDDEIRALGGRIFAGPRFRRRAHAARYLAQVLRSHGPFCAVHAHGRHDMAWPLTVARLAGVPARIGHVHNVKDSHGEDPVRRAYKRAMKRALAASATWILGCSGDALASLFGPDEPVKPRAQEVLPYGIDPAVFSPGDTRAAVLGAFDLPADCLLAGHVGRFVWEKNHGFLVRAFAELARRDPRWHLLLVGDGRLRDDIERAVRQAGLGARVRLAGVRADVPELVSAMDVFLFPSVIEGFGLVMVEAQALGVPCVLGAHLPAELDVYPPAMTRVALDAGPSAWADAAENAARRWGFIGDPGARARLAADAHARVVESPFNIDRSVATLLSRYYNLAHAG